MTRASIWLCLLTAATGCEQHVEECVVTSPEEMSQIGDIYRAGGQCDLLVVRNTELTTLAGAEPVDSAFSIYVGSNDGLVDVSQLSGVDAAQVTVALNAELRDVALGPLSTELIDISNNAAESVELKIGRDGGEVRIAEPALQDLVLRGAATIDALHIHSAVPVRAEIEVIPTRLSVIGAEGVVDHQQLAPLGVPGEFVGLYGLGIEPQSAEADAYAVWLEGQGFTGTVETCPHPCDAGAESACSEARPPGAHRQGCSQSSL